MRNRREEFLKQAIALALSNVSSGHGGPFGAVIVKDGEAISSGRNLVLANKDPSAHAEIVAIRAACEALQSFHLSGCEIYASCEPCPMCLGAIYWARLSRLYFASTREDAASAGFDDARIYREIALPTESRALPTECLLLEEGKEPFRRWLQSDQRIVY